MTEKIIIFLFFAVFIFLLMMLLSNSRMRKKNNQPTLKELEEIYKLSFKKTPNYKRPKRLHAIGSKPVTTSALLTAVVALLVVSSDVLQIVNNGPNPCDVKKINFNPNTDCQLEITNEDFWSCI